MLGTKNGILCDRRVYSFKGQWENPNEDIRMNIFYFVDTPMTLASSWENGREELKPTMTIVVFGEHAFCKHDIIYLQDGTMFEIGEITNNFLEPNILIRDMVKQRTESQILTLE